MKTSFLKPEKNVPKKTKRRELADKACDDPCKKSLLIFYFCKSSNRKTPKAKFLKAKFSKSNSKRHCLAFLRTMSAAAFRINLIHLNI